MFLGNCKSGKACDTLKQWEALKGLKTELNSDNFFCYLPPQVPCLIKELLERRFNSAEAIQQFLTTSAPTGHAATPQAESQSHAPKTEEAAPDWMLKSEGGSQRVTAFSPFKHGGAQAMNEDGISGQREPVYSPPLSLDDISSAIYNKMAARYAARSQSHYPQQPPLADTPPNFQQANVDGDSWSGKAGVKVRHLEEHVVDVTSMSAQKILDEFMRQLQPYQEAGKGEEQH